MKNVTITPAAPASILDGDLKLQMSCSYVQDWHLASNWNSHFYENFLRHKNGPARCQLPKPLEKYLLLSKRDKLAHTTGEPMGVN
ncbi:MAG: hypothetical protein LBB26_03980 [Puniceicoccales bacterium]|jgi:hypothetical protein|nr:hypothetical protein [Puniceicoccales bacterium]